MRSFIVAAGVALSCVASSSAVVVQGDAHPVQKIITLLDKLAAQVKDEGKEEEYSYAKFSKWCQDVNKEKSTAISQHKEHIAVYSSEIEALTAEIETLGEEVDALDKQLTKDGASLKHAAGIRGEEHDDYVEAQADYDAVLTALDEAIQGMLDSKPASFAVKKVVRKAMVMSQADMSAEEHKSLRSFLQGAPVDRVGKQKTYEFKSGGVIELLKKLKAKFQNEKLESNKGETNSANSHDLSNKAKEAAVAAATKSKTDKEELKSSKGQEKAGTLGDLKQAENDLETDTAFLETVKKNCQQKSDEWQERTKTREGEIAAMKMAISILEKQSNTRNPDSYEAASREKARALSFLEVESTDPKTKVVNLLKKVASEVHNTALAKLASSIEQMPTMQSDAVRKADPFHQIKGMIQKMIFQLQAEQKDEDEHKHWCDLEVEKSSNSKDQKTEDLELLNKKINAMNAEIDELSTQVEELNQDVADLQQHMAEEQQIRKENKAENKAAIKEAQEAQSAVQNAITVLTAFYKESGDMEKKPWDFVQVSGDGDAAAGPSTWDNEYTGVSGGTGVIDMLKEVAEKFAQTEANCKNQEETDEKAFDEDQTASSVSMAEKQQSAKMKDNRKAMLTEKVDNKMKVKAHLQSELEAVTQYLKDLQPACVNGDSSFADRKAARTKEIEALRQAQNILQEAFAAGQEPAGPGPAPAPPAMFLAKH